jgi:hypothetical protein
VRKEDGARGDVRAWTDAAANSRKDRENVAAPNTLNLTIIPRRARQMAARRHEANRN